MGTLGRQFGGATGEYLAKKALNTRYGRQIIGNGSALRPAIITVGARRLGEHLGDYVPYKKGGKVKKAKKRKAKK